MHSHNQNPHLRHDLLACLQVGDHVIRKGTWIHINIYGEMPYLHLPSTAWLASLRA